MRILRQVFELIIAVSLVIPLAFAESDPAPDSPVFTEAELDQMLAPIALYPDSLLSQLLMAATYPLEVVEAARWSRDNPDLKGQDAVRAVEDQSWDASVKSLVAFPEVLSQMDADLEWTERLGDAFLAQQSDVMDRVQSLRQKAEDAGNLESGEHYSVVHDGPTIVVASPYPDVVYVPYYDPFVVYGTWWWPHYYPVRWDPWYGYNPMYAGYSGIYWGGGITIGTGFFYSDWDWHHHYVHVVDNTPWYYREQRPAHNVWVHEPRHRLGVPYRSTTVYNRYSREEPRARYQQRDRNVPLVRESSQQSRTRDNRVDDRDRAYQHGARDVPGSTSRVDRSGVPQERTRDNRDTAMPRSTQPSSANRESQRSRESNERSVDTRHYPSDSSRSGASVNTEERHGNRTESTRPATGSTIHQQQPDVQQRSHGERSEPTRAPTIWSSSPQRESGGRSSDSGVRLEPQQRAEPVMRPAPVEERSQPVVGGGNQDRSSGSAHDSRPATDDRDDRSSGHQDHDRGGNHR